MARKQKRRKGNRRNQDKADTGTAADGSLLVQATRAHQNGDSSLAERSYRKYLRHDPGNGEVWHRLGGLLYQLDKIPAATEALEQAAKLLPQESDVVSDLGGLYLSIDRLDDAERAFRAALAISPGSIGAQYNLSIALYSQGRVAESISHLVRLVDLQPDFAEAHYNLGVAFRTEGKTRNALASLEKAYALQPLNSGVLLELARTCSELHMSDRARKFYQDYLGYTRDPDAIVEYAELLYENGEGDSAEEILTQRISEAPDDEKAYLSLARIRHNAGDLTGSEQILRDVLRVNPASIPAIVGLSRVRRVTDPEDPVLALMRRMLDQVGADEAHSSVLHFSIAKIYDDLGSYDDAIEHYRKANAIKHRQCHYDSSKTTEVFSRTIEFFDQKTINALSNVGAQSDVPILVVGMPRSGTTLVEQVISSHPQAAGAGELQFFPSLTHQLPKILESKLRYPECVAVLDQASADTITENYLELLRRRSSDALRITDKLPGNYLHVGLFKGLFPNGRVISCRRDPIDVALSIYFQFFADGHEYAWDLDDIAFQYTQYERVMQHWLKLLPGSILEVYYEDVVSNFEARARRLVDFCGLAWDDTCLDFHQTKRDVKTASNWQVRQPIYHRSVARWRHYERHINSLIEALKPYRRSSSS